MPTLQQQIDAILRTGKRPSVTLWPGIEIVMPKRRRGRPRVRDLARPFAHYADKRASVRPVRCLAEGCQRRLKVRQRGTCCEAHGDAVFNQALSLLRMIDATKEEVTECYAGPQKPSQQPTPLELHRASLPRPSERQLRAARRAFAKSMRKG
jgi:hypothetical protein